MVLPAYSTARFGQGRGEMESISFSEVTSRLRRNLMALAAIVIFIAAFDIRIGRAASQGLEFEGLTTQVVMIILSVLLVYHMIAFGIRAYEEYRLWEITFADRQASTYGGHILTLDVVKRFVEALPGLEELAKTGKIEGGAERVNEALKLLEAYGKRFENFPKITRVRFWAWDIGTTVLVTVVALGLAVRHQPGPPL